MTRTGVSNWTELELTAFVEEISSRQELIFRRHRPVNPEIDLDAIWASVANACADRGFERFAGRTRKQLQCDLWGKKKKEWERLIIDMCKNNGGEEETPNRKRPIEEQFLALANYQSNNSNKNGSNMDEIAQTSSNLGWPKHVKLEIEIFQLAPDAKQWLKSIPNRGNTINNCASTSNDPLLYRFQEVID
uniref:Myb/SANT-like domain-containing protein n=1 Tax=Meloidogyne javanica TaxID=6303 RepID=A0A915LKW0_MELJA